MQMEIENNDEIIENEGMMDGDGEMTHIIRFLPDWRNILVQRFKQWVRIRQRRYVINGLEATIDAIQCIQNPFPLIGDEFRFIQNVVHRDPLALRFLQIFAQIVVSLLGMWKPTDALTYGCIHLWRERHLISFDHTTYFLHSLPIGTACVVMQQRRVQIDISSRDFFSGQVLQHGKRTTVHTCVHASIYVRFPIND